MMSRTATIGWITAAALWWHTAAKAQDADTPADSSPAPTGLTLELNNASDVNGVCRLTYVAFNGTTTVFNDIAYEAVMFDSDQRAAQFLLLEFGSLPSQKTKVVRFDISDIACSSISRVLVNSVSKCEADGATLPVCIDGLVATSRTDIDFGL